MRIALFDFLWRPQVDTQNTGRAVYERPLSVGTVSVAGLGGANNIRSIAAVSPTSFNSPYFAVASLTGIGNDFNANPVLVPLNNRPNPQF